MYVPEKYVCRECGWQGAREDRLAAPSPFRSVCTIYGCPNCRNIDCFRGTCDEPGCWSEDECGTPTPDGYRRTCCEHMPDKKPT